MDEPHSESPSPVVGFVLSRDQVQDIPSIPPRVPCVQPDSDVPTPYCSIAFAVTALVFGRPRD